VKYYESLRLKKDPFAAEPDPEFFFPTRDYAWCIRRIELSLHMRGGIDVILGESGVGKTALARVLIDRLQARRKNSIVKLLPRPDSGSEFKFLQQICRALDIGAKYRTRLECRQAIHDYAFRSVIEEGKTLVLVIDDGERLSTGNIEVLGELLRCQFDGSGLMNVVMLGRTGLLDKITGSGSRDIRVDLVYTINPLDPDDLKEYIFHRLRKAGCGNVEMLFDDMAVNEIWCFSRGNPLKANSMCCHSLISMKERNVDIVSPETVRMVARNWNMQ